MKPHGSAVADLIPYTFNSGVIVIEPNTETFKKMVTATQKIHSYNSGDQGFFNNMIPWRNDTSLHLPLKFNYLTSFLQHSYLWQSSDPPRIIHFTSEIKPWTYYFAGHAYPDVYKKNFHPYLYYQWWGLHREITKFNPKAYGVLNANTCQKMVSKRNILPTMCTVLVSHFGTSRSVLFQKRILPYLLRHKFIKTVIIGLAGGATYENCHENNRLKCVSLESNSFSARFSIVKYSTTECIIIADDDMETYEPYGLDFMYSKWQEQPQRMVGTFQRKWGYDDSYIYTAFNRSNGPHGFAYSFVLTKTLFAPISLIRNFVCALPEKVYQIIEKYHQCEDIALNLLYLGSGVGCPVILGVKFIDYGSNNDKLGGLSTSPNHLDRRTNCLRELVHIFNVRSQNHQCFGMVTPITGSRYFVRTKYFVVFGKSE